jgi:hypothetical protein
MSQRCLPIAVIPACPLSGTLPHIVENLGVDESATYLKQLRCAGWGRFVARPPRPVALRQPVRPSHGRPSGCDVQLHNRGSAAQQFSPTKNHPRIDQPRNAQTPFHFGPKKYADRADSSASRLGIVLSRHLGHRDKAEHTRSKFVQRPDLDQGLWPAPVAPLRPPLLLQIARGRCQLMQAPSDHLYQVQWPVSPVGEPPTRLQHHHCSSQTSTSGQSNVPPARMGLRGPDRELHPVR